MDSPGSNSLGKLLPKAISRRRKATGKSSTSSRDSLGDSSEEARGRSQLLSRRENSTTTVESDGSKIADDESASFASHESDPDPSAPRPPPISAHPSQIGQLTTSSPIVQAEHQVEQMSLADYTSEATSKSPTFPSLRSDSVDSESSQRSRTNTGTLLPPRSSSRRSPSPVGRIRDVFRSKKPTSGLTASEQADGERASGRAESPDKAKPEDTTSDPKAAVTEKRRARAHSRLDTSLRPSTPPTQEGQAPVIVNTPPTPTDPNSTRDPLPPARRGALDDSPGAGSPPSTAVMQRRARAGSGSLGPSKLSNIISAPKTPTLENGPATPSLNAASGFFSSVLSAAQNAANTLSNSIQNTNIGQAGKTKGPNTREPDIIEEETVETEPHEEAVANEPASSKELAVKTLGTGELSLSQLGIVDSGSAAPTPLSAKFPDTMENRIRADSAPADVTPIRAQAEPSLDDGLSWNRPKSMHEGPNGDRITPTPSVHEEKSGLERTSSVRSAMARRRKRASSATTGGTGGTATTIAAAIAAANASVANPSAGANSAPKLTGFAVASKKRNRDFHSFFKSVPDDDYLIEDYSCAYQREILAHGRLYVSEGHLCFSSNILGWTTTLVMSFDEIVSVEKRSTALIFKNGLLISTLHAKHVFASFASRDTTYDLIVNIWKLGHPSLQSTLNGVRLDGTGGDKTEKVDENAAAAEIDKEHDANSESGSEEDSEEDEDFYDEDDDDHVAESTQQTELTIPPTTELEKVVTRKPSGVVPANGVPAEAPKDAGTPATSIDFPGPAAHAPTDCGDAATHYDKIVGDDVIPAPMGKVYNLLFGAQSPVWMNDWLSRDQKCSDIQMEDKKGLSLENKARTYTYIKPLYATIGPKQTKCIVTETLDRFDLENAVNLSVSTQNPDVPNGNIFTVKTKYCLSWAPNNGTRVQVNCSVEWTSKSWLKGTIEKAANEGQTTFCTDLFKSLKAAVSANRPRSGTGNGAATKGNKKGRRRKAALSTSDAGEGERSPKHNAKKSNWGPLEPLHSILEPVIDIIRPLMTGNVVYGLLVGLLVATWFGFGFNNTRRPGTSPYGHDMSLFGHHPDRLAAYEEMWRREESELWEWLEERVGLDRLADGSPPVRKRVVEPRTMEEKLREERMDEREVQAAIRVTEEKLRLLKDAMEKMGGAADVQKAARRKDKASEVPD